MKEELLQISTSSHLFENTSFHFTLTGGLMGSDQKSTIIGIVVAFVLLLIIIIIFVCWYRRHLKQKYAKYLEPNESFVVCFV